MWLACRRRFARQAFKLAALKAKERASWLLCHSFLTFAFYIRAVRIDMEDTTIIRSWVAEGVCPLSSVQTFRFARRRFVFRFGLFHGCACSAGNQRWLM